jgi:hypothetical protein
VGGTVIVLAAVVVAVVAAFVEAVLARWVG